MLFTRTGLPIIGFERNIVVDMRKDITKPFDPGREYNKFEKIGERMYYIKMRMPEF